MRDGELEECITHLNAKFYGGVWADARGAISPSPPGWTDGTVGQACDDLSLQ